MESDGENAVVKGRSMRRSKIGQQNERSTNEENIDGTSGIDGTTTENNSMDVDINAKARAVLDNRQLSSTPNSSTPRRRKDPLANLHSNLSPKYIGFVATTSNLDNNTEDRSRKTRRRHNQSNNGQDLSLSKDTPDMDDDISGGKLFGVHDTSVGYVRRITREPTNSPENRNGRRKEFVSPIDKLLRKNRSMVEADKLVGDDPWAEKEKLLKNHSFPDEKHIFRDEIFVNNNHNHVYDKNEADANNECGKGMKKHQNEYHTDGNANGYNSGQLSESEKDMSSENENNSQGNSDSQGKNNDTKTEIYNSDAVDTPSPVKLVKSTDSIRRKDRDKSIDTANDKLSENGEEKQSECENAFDEEIDERCPKISNDNLVKQNLMETKCNDIDENANEKHMATTPTPEQDASNTIEVGNTTEGHDDDAIAENEYKSEDARDMVDGVGEVDANTDFVHTSSAKSPSTISMDSAKGSSILNEGTWMSFSTGDLFWGQIYNYCYWPCMVCPDPEGKTITAKENVTSSDQHVLVHVRFFADNARRNWVKRENLMPFTTLEQYQERLDDCRQKYGTKSAKFKQFVPKKNKVAVWYEAVNEANMVAAVPYEDRLEKFYEIFDKSKLSQKNKQQRRKSMYIPASKNLTASDAESLYGSHENINNLSAPVTAGKRERSTSPFSPAYSPIKHLSVKKRKLSADLAVSTDTETISSSDTIEISSGDQKMSNNDQQSVARKSLDDFNLFHSKAFQDFYVAMKDFVLQDNTDENLDKSLLVAVRNIWALKQLSHQQMQCKLSLTTNELDTSTNNAHDTEPGGVKRLSSRLRTLMMRKSMLSQRSSIDLTNETQTVAKVSQPKDTLIEKPKKMVNRPILEVIDDIFELDNKYLFKGLGRDPVCKYCFKPGGSLRRCTGRCHGWLHPECLHINFSENGKVRKWHKRGISAIKSVNDSNLEASKSNSSSTTDLASIEPSPESSSAVPHITAETEVEVTCRECANNEPTKCMVCKLTDSAKVDDPLVKCTMGQCDRAFHPACCKYWPQSKITISKNRIQSFRCPSHVCHTCVSDDPKGKFQQLSNAKITKCVKCPATYHTDSTCIPAGSQILTAAHIICPRHSSTKHDQTLNVNWCFICVRGGQVVCCETCPTAVHAQCLKIPIDPNEGYICEECESGRMPLYGEMVWAKFTHFRWWPAIILPPTEIPTNIAKKNHNPSDFVVRFFGTHDHGWISRRRVYLYLEGDSSEPPKTKAAIDKYYNEGIVEAKKIYEIVKAKKQQQRMSNENKERLHPQPYTRIKANRPVPPVKLHIDIESVSKCECDPNEENPCGPESNCLNRVLYHECNPKVCPAGERCQNQMFETRKSPQLDVIYMKERGFGLITREPIKSGTFVIEYVGEVINDDEFRARMAQKSLDRDENFYFLSVEKDYIIDAGPKGNLARFMNHSCDPNCETQKWSVNSLNRVGLFAIKDIPENTELTFNYHWDDLLGNEKKTCYCGSKNCVGQIGGKKKDMDNKETSPSSDDPKPKSTKGRKKSKVKPLKKGLHAKPVGVVKRKPATKLKINASTKYKSNKMAAAAAVAATLSKKQLSPGENNITADNEEEEAVSNIYTKTDVDMS
ncbi:nuclear receptor binding SET domain protein [Musca vetustissima]|uniref:nuclear receptor binding SET domain protein n=1 Tax=Musca vetustissima TaxID=27455 RepID=UPI002AB77902|nr:nuclear receptor binding SET domain protein [Musca vetustissima]